MKIFLYCFLVGLGFGAFKAYGKVSLVDMQYHSPELGLIFDTNEPLKKDTVVKTLIKIKDQEPLIFERTLKEGESTRRMISFYIPPAWRGMRFPKRIEVIVYIDGQQALTLKKHIVLHQVVRGPVRFYPNRSLSHIRGE